MLFYDGSVMFEYVENKKYLKLTPGSAFSQCCTLVRARLRKTGRFCHPHAMTDGFFLIISPFFNFLQLF